MSSWRVGEILHQGAQLGRQRGDTIDPALVLLRRRMRILPEPPDRVPEPLQGGVFRAGGACIVAARCVGLHVRHHIANRACVDSAGIAAPPVHGCSASASRMRSRMSPVQHQGDVVGALADDHRTALPLQEPDLGIAEATDHGVRGGIHVDRLAQVGAGEQVGVAVVKGGAGDEQLDRLLAGGGAPPGRLRGGCVGEVVEHAGQRPVDELVRHVQAPRHQQVAVGAGGAVLRQVARYQKRSVGVAHHHHALVPCLEVFDHAAQQLHADVDLGLQVGQGQAGMPGREARIEGEGLVYLHQVNVLVIGQAQERKQHVVADVVRRAALLEDPHRFGARTRRGGVDHEQLGDVGRQPRGPVLADEAATTRQQQRKQGRREPARMRGHSRGTGVGRRGGSRVYNW